MRVFQRSGARVAYVFLGGLILGGASPAAPSTAKNLSTQIREIDKSCKAIEAALKGNDGSVGSSPQVFAVLSPEAPEEWKSFAGLAELQEASPKGCYRKALLYHLPQNLFFVSCEFKGPSKEWVQYLKFYYREDGTLEKIHSDYRRFGAYEKSKGMEQQFLAKVLRDRYYDSDGKCVKKTAPRCFNVSNGREYRDVVFTDAPWPVFQRVEKLPFYPLASNAPAASTPSATPLSTP